MNYLSRSRWAGKLSVSLPVLIGAWACSPSVGQSGLDPNGGGGAAAGSGAGASGASNGAGSTVSTSAGGADSVIGIGDPGTGGGSSSTGPDGGCFATASKAEQITQDVTVDVVENKPFDMFIMYDQSGSMGENTPVGTKWTAIGNAVTAFVNDPGNADVGVGMAFFPLTPPPCNAPSATCVCIPFINICGSTGGGSCTAADYAVPTVPIETLPTVAPKIISAIGAHNPGGGTPTAPALAGALQYAEGWAAAHLDRKTIVVLATDGDPTGCTANAVSDVATIAAGGLAANPPVQTFVVGVGSSLTSLNSIAAAGGTTQALIVDASSGDPTKQFLDAMNKIRQKVTQTVTSTQVVSKPVPCQWGIPASPDGKTFDKTKVNVQYTDTAAGVTSQVGAVTTQADCANVAQGWYYDDPANPTQVLVCPQTCTTVQAILGVEVQVVFGCSTKPAVLQ